MKEYGMYVINNANCNLCKPERQCSSSRNGRNIVVFEAEKAIKTTSEVPIVQCSKFQAFQSVSRYFTEL